MIGKQYHCCDSKSRSRSSVHAKSRLDVFSPYISVETALSRATYNPNNKLSTELKDRDAIIKALMKRISLMSPKDSRVSILQEQVNTIRRELDFLKSHRDKALKQRDDLLQYLTINTGKVVPIEAVRQVVTSRMSRGNQLMTPIGSAEQAFENMPEGQGVGKFSTGPMGGDADVKQEQDEAPEGSFNNSSSQTIAPSSMSTGTGTEMFTREQSTSAQPMTVESGTEPDLVTREQGMTAEPQTVEMGTEPQSESDYENESDTESEPGTEADFEEYQRLRDLPVWLGDEADEFNAIMERHPEFDPEYFGEEEEVEEPDKRPFNINRDVTPTQLNEFLQFKGVTYNPLGRRRGYKSELIRQVKKNNLEDQLERYLRDKNM